MSRVIKNKGEELTRGAHSQQEMSKRIIQFVRDQISYNLDEWNVKPSEVLRKGRGMCAGKALLGAELYRAVGMPARFKVIKLLGEQGLFNFVRRQLEEQEVPGLLSEEKDRIIDKVLSLPVERDHIILQVFLNGQWVDLDLARDTNLDYGMRVLGIWEERKVIFEEGIFDSLDKWLEERMRRRTVLQNRKLFFTVVNKQIEKLRILGRRAKKSGYLLKRSGFENWLSIHPD